MRFSPALIVLAASVSIVSAQRAADPTGFGRISSPGGAIGSTGGAGFGRLIYPGTGAPVAVRNPRLPGSPLVAAPVPQVPHRPHGNVVAVPYPVFYGGSFYDYDAPPAPIGGYPQPGYQGTGYDQATQPPVVIINQYFKPDTLGKILDLPPVSSGRSRREANVEFLAGGGCNLLWCHRARLATASTASRIRLLR